MISSITPILTGIEQLNGYTKANAQGFTDNDDSGEVDFLIGEYYDWETDVTTGSNDMYFAVLLTANTTYTATDAAKNCSWDGGPMIQFESSSSSDTLGTAYSIVEDWDEETYQTIYTQTPASFTPTTDGVYYLHIYFQPEMEQTTIKLQVSPRPNEHSCATRRLWKTASWEQAAGVLVESRMSGIPVSPVFSLPLLSNATPAINTVNANVSTSGNITFDGGASKTDGDIYIEVYMPTVFAGSYTVSALWYPVSDDESNNRHILSLYDMTNSYVDSHFSLCLMSRGGVGLYAHDRPFLDESPWKPGRWHAISMVVDQDTSEVRVLVDGKFSTCHKLSQAEQKKGPFNTTGCIRLFTPGNYLQQCSGKIKNLQVISTALDFNQMRYLSSKLLS